MTTLGTSDSLFAQMGGEAVLRRVIDRFVDQVFDDTMIGFFFRNASRERIKAKEYEHAAEHLGGGVPYTGRPLDVAHAAHPILGGHFMRRLQILKDVLADAEVPAHIVQHWILHTESLRPLITDQPGSECSEPGAHRVGKSRAPPRLPLANSPMPKKSTPDSSWTSSSATDEEVEK